MNQAGQWQAVFTVTGHYMDLVILHLYSGDNALHWWLGRVHTSTVGRIIHCLRGPHALHGSIRKPTGSLLKGKKEERPWGPAACTAAVAVEREPWSISHLLVRPSCVTLFRHDGYVQKNRRHQSYTVYIYIYMGRRRISDRWRQNVCEKIRRRDRQVL